MRSTTAQKAATAAIRPRHEGIAPAWPRLGIQNEPLLRRGLRLLNVLQEGVEPVGERQQDPEMLAEAANAYESAIPEWTREGCNPSSAPVTRRVVG
jgi:hypothetical protein